MNKKFLKYYMETEPESTAKKYIFLMDNQGKRQWRNKMKRIEQKRTDKIIVDHLTKDYGHGRGIFDMSVLRIISMRL